MKINIKEFIESQTGIMGLSATEAEILHKELNELLEYKEKCEKQDQTIGTLESDLSGYKTDMFEYKEKCVQLEKEKELIKNIMTFGEDVKEIKYSTIVNMQTRIEEFEKENKNLQIVNDLFINDIKILVEENKQLKEGDLLGKALTLALEKKLPIYKGETSWYIFIVPNSTGAELIDWYKQWLKKEDNDG